MQENEEAKIVPSYCGVIKSQGCHIPFKIHLSEQLFMPKIRKFPYFICLGTLSILEPLKFLLGVKVLAAEVQQLKIFIHHETKNASRRKKFFSS